MLLREVLASQQQHLLMEATDHRNLGLLLGVRVSGLRGCLGLRLLGGLVTCGLSLSLALFRSMDGCDSSGRGRSVTLSAIRNFVLSLLQADPLTLIRWVNRAGSDCEALLLGLLMQEDLRVLGIELLGRMGISSEKQGSFIASGRLECVIIMGVLLTAAWWPVITGFHHILVMVHDLVRSHR